MGNVGKFLSNLKVGLNCLYLTFTGFGKLMVLSPALAEVVGEEKVSGI